VRTLSAPLLAAQKAPSGAPFVRVEVEGRIRGINHLVYSEVFTAFVADDAHDAAADTTYLHRVRANSVTGRPQYERGYGAGWIDLSTLSTTNVIAVAVVNNARVFVVYNRGLSVYFRESADQGATFGTETLIASAAILTPTGVGVAYKDSTGTCVVIIDIDSIITRYRRTGVGAFGAGLAMPTPRPATLTGMAMKFSGDYNIVVTGTEVSTLRPTVWTLILGEGFSVTLDVWAALFIVQQAETDQLVVFKAPHLGPPDIASRLSFVERFTGSPTYDRSYWSERHLADPFSPGNWEWLDPVPFDDTAANGLALAGDGVTYAYTSRPAEVNRAPYVATGSPKDMSADLVEATVEENGIRARGEFVFDNAGGQWAGPPAPIQLGRDVDIGLGYDALFSRPAGQAIVGWEYRRDGGESVFVVRTRGADYWLEGGRARTSVSPGTLAFSILYRGICARAGVEESHAALSVRAANFALAWTVHPFESALSAVEALLAMMADVARPDSGFGASAIRTFEPLGSDAVNYDYVAEGHAIYRSRTERERREALAEVVGVGTVLGQAFDFPEMAENKGLADRRRGPHEVTAGNAADHAAARLRKGVLESDRGYLVTSPHCGMEVGDVVQYSDALVSATVVKARVRAVRTRFVRGGGRSRKAVFEQRVELGGV
jgi:hypothetical protein